MAKPKRGLGPRSRRMRDRRSPSGERGDTLVELLVTIVVMGIAVTTILGGILTSVEASTLHREQATAQTYLRSYAEAIESYLDDSPGNYRPCARTTDYPSPQQLSGLIIPAGYNAKIDTIAYWTSTGSGDNGDPWNTDRFDCQRNNDSGDIGVQRLDLQVQRSTDPRVTETLSIIIREPCTDQTCT